MNKGQKKVRKKEVHNGHKNSIMSVVRYFYLTDTFAINLI